MSAADWRDDLVLVGVDEERSRLLHNVMWVPGRTQFTTTATHVIIYDDALRKILEPQAPVGQVIFDDDPHYITRLARILLHRHTAERRERRRKNQRKRWLKGGRGKFS